MTNSCVVVAEGARARFFTLESSDVPDLEGGPDLVEHDSLINPEHRARQDQIYADSSGRNRTPGGQGQIYDEHRDQHNANTEKRFAREIAERIDQLGCRAGARRAFLCAEKRMLGFLRTSLGENTPNGLEIQEIPKDLTKLKPREIQEHLAKDGYIPRRKAPNAKQ
jgi:protein required for attachment to host cells